ncbi:peptidoglycan-binding protein [Labrenzia sp. VG12]|uniref:peptidoglycan-binding domain-containing protein n=1 Tax=Labrenzia sp. VG12 TaxID=2021862 RepID=UPI0012FD9B82|nr:peptidoglycan-binding domain-containing protein [Labrenzia sp. VG12]
MRVFAALATVLCLTLLASVGTASASNRLSLEKSGSWVIAAYADGTDATTFTKCIMVLPLSQGRYFGLGLFTSGNYVVILGLGENRVTEGASYNARISVDRRWALETSTEAMTSDSVRFFPGNEIATSRALTAIAEGSRLNFQITGLKRNTLSLRGSRRAIRALQRCHQTYAPQVVAQTEPEAPDIQPSADIRDLAREVGIPVPSGSLRQLRENADTLDPRAQLVFVLALMDQTDYGRFKEEAIGHVTLVADADDPRGLFLLARMMELGFDDESYSGHASDLISQAADLGHPEALVRRALARRAQEPEAALADLELAAASGHRGARDILKDWHAENRAAQTTTPPPVTALPTPVPVPAPQTAPTIKGNKARFSTGEAVSVEFGNLPTGQLNWIAIAAADHDADAFYDLLMLQDGRQAGTHTFKLLPDGDYELRVYLDWPNGGHEIAAKAPVTVGNIALPSTQPLPEPVVQPPPNVPDAAAAHTAETVPSGPKNDSMRSDYSDQGALACFGGATYPESWKKDGQCVDHGCYFGLREQAACLEIGTARSAPLVMYGAAGGPRARECWLQTTCGDLRPQDNYRVFRKQGTGAETDSVATEAADTGRNTSDETANSALPGDPELIMAIQALLSSMGYEVGMLDGSLSPQTRAALTAFQVARGLHADGLPSAALRDEALSAVASGHRRLQEKGPDEPSLSTQPAPAAQSEVQSSPALPPEGSEAPAPEPEPRTASPPSAETPPETAQDKTRPGISYASHAGGEKTVVHDDSGMDKKWYGQTAYHPAGRVTYIYDGDGYIREIKRYLSEGEKQDFIEREEFDRAGQLREFERRPVVSAGEDDKVRRYFGVDGKPLAKDGYPEDLYAGACFAAASQGAEIPILASLSIPRCGYRDNRLCTCYGGKWQGQKRCNDATDAQPFNGVAVKQNKKTGKTVLKVYFAGGHRCGERRFDPDTGQQSGEKLLGTVEQIRADR